MFATKGELMYDTNTTGTRPERKTGEDQLRYGSFWGLCLPAGATHPGWSSEFRCSRAMTRLKKPKMKIVVTLRQPWNTKRPVPA
jgi:hypothetical protein